MWLFKPTRLGPGHYPWNREIISVVIAAELICFSNQVDHPTSSVKLPRSALDQLCAAPALQNLQLQILHPTARPKQILGANIFRTWLSQCLCQEYLYTALASQFFDWRLDPFLASWLAEPEAPL